MSSALAQSSTSCLSLTLPSTLPSRPSSPVSLTEPLTLYLLYPPNTPSLPAFRS
ncbi:hypothetical protein E2C01_076878 [Portunus trituberculatus]|uniref:Uncharacterized protein n=1 Tax=Portunus trituberculatus TaxID=210409 RepID=A0A5B7IN57_PORTR|nr:hypothetical protein [Portunus trituberculatus]